MKCKALPRACELILAAWHSVSPINFEKVSKNLPPEKQTHKKSVGIASLRAEI
jgi:hypothetical protein